MKIVDIRIKENSATTDDTVVRNFEKKAIDWNFSILAFTFSSKRETFQSCSARRERCPCNIDRFGIRNRNSNRSIDRQWDRRTMARNTVVIINLPSILVHAEKGYEIFIFIYEECTRPYWFFDVNAAASLFERAPFQLFTRFHRRTKRA